MRYYYSKLNDEKKEAYKKIYYAIENLEPKVNISVKAFETNEIFKLYEYVILDNPLLFYVNPYSSQVFTYDSSNYGLVFEYLYNKREIEAKKNHIEKKLKDIEKKILSYDTKIDRERYIHRYIMSNMDYDYKTDYKKDMVCHTIEGVLLHRKAVCDGISKLFKLMCNMAKINCFVIIGNSWNQYEPPQPHAWNMVKIDGNWYHMDMTWDLNLSKRFEYVRYDYFNLREEDIRKDHSDFTSFEECDSLVNNYFYENNCIIHGEQALEDFMYKKIKEIIKNGKDINYISMKFYDNTSKDVTNLIFKVVEKTIRRCAYSAGIIKKYSLCPNSTQDVYVLIIEM